MNPGFKLTGEVVFLLSHKALYCQAFRDFCCVQSKSATVFWLTAYIDLLFFIMSECITTDRDVKRVDKIPGMPCNVMQ